MGRRQQGSVLSCTARLADLGKSELDGLRGLDGQAEQTELRQAGWAERAALSL